VFAEYNNPEMINNSKENSPGHRLERIIKGYDKIVRNNSPKSKDKTTDKSSDKKDKSNI